MLMIAPSGCAGGAGLSHDDDRTSDRAPSVLTPASNAAGRSVRGTNARQFIWSRRLSLRRDLLDSASVDGRISVEIARADPEQYLGTRRRL